MPDNENTSDAGFENDAALGVTAYQSGGLIAYTRRLAELTEQAGSQYDEECLATSAVLMASAAIDALLSDYVYCVHRSAFTKGFRMSGITKKYHRIRELEESEAEFAEEVLADDHPDVAAFWADRVAIFHSEANNERTRTYGARINKAGARQCVIVLEKFALALWGPRMPPWLRSDAGLGI